MYMYYPQVQEVYFDLDRVIKVTLAFSVSTSEYSKSELLIIGYLGENHLKILQIGKKSSLKLTDNYIHC